MRREAKRIWRCVELIVFAGLISFGAGCGGDSNSSTPPARAPQAGPALVVGPAAGTVFDALKNRYGAASGTGAEDPSNYSMIVFDGDNTLPGQLQSNPGVADFVNAGKPVIILNATESHLVSGLADSVWAYGDQLPTVSPAVAFVMRRQPHRLASDLVEIDFPLEIAAAPDAQPAPPPPSGSNPAATPPILVNPTPEELNAETRQWLATLNRTLASSLGDIPPAQGGPGQMVLSFAKVDPIRIVQSSVLNNQPPPYGTAWGPSGTQPPNFSTEFSGTFYTRLYAILKGDSPQNFQHEIIARQYLLVSPPSPLATDLVTSQYAIAGSNWNGSWPVYSTLGFNDAFTLATQLNDPSDSNLALGVTENLPQAANGVNTLTTSQSHTETVGLSVTGGIQNGNGVGTVGASWSSSWTWGEASTISFCDWESSSNVDIPDNAAQYNFVAYGGSDLTTANLSDDLLALPPNNNQIANQLRAPFDYWPPSNRFPTLNQLQKSAMTNQSETVWTTSSGQLIPPDQLQFISSALVYSGEMLELRGGILFFAPDGVFTGYGRSNFYQVINLNFAAPGLQPPGLRIADQTQVAAPWTLTFGQFSQRKGRPYATVTGTVALTQPAPSGGTRVNLSYVIQPRQQMLTLPPNQACQGNTTSFNPGNSVLDNGNPPLNVTIPAGQTAASFPLTFQTFNADTYNVQVAAWQARATVGGDAVLNPQSAWCLTPPNTLP